MNPCDNCGKMTEEYRAITGPELEMEVPLCEDCSN